MPELRERERRFVDAMVGPAAGNATKAAQLAGYSPRSARFQGSKLATRRNIQAAIAHAQAQLSEHSGVDAARLIEELAAVGFSDVRALFDAAGDLLPIRDLSDAAAKAVSSVEVTKQRTTTSGETVTTETVRKVRQWDKLRALELIAKLQGMFPSEKHEHTFTLEDLASASRGELTA